MRGKTRVDSLSQLGIAISGNSLLTSELPLTTSRLTCPSCVKRGRNLSNFLVLPDIYITTLRRARNHQPWNNNKHCASIKSTTRNASSLPNSILNKYRQKIMPPKARTTGSFVYVVLDGSEIDSVHAVSTAASQRVVELDSEEAEVVKKELQGGTVQVNEKVAAEPKTTKAKTAKRKQSEDPEPAPEPKKKAAPKKSTKIEEEDEDVEEGPKPTISKAKTKTPAEQRAANAKKPVKPEDSDLPDNVKALLAGSGNALEGKNIVVTGVPPTLGRKNAEALVEKYGGHLTKSLSKKTSLVVVGNDAGPTKLEKIADLGVDTLNEDEFVALLEG